MLIVIFYSCISRLYSCTRDERKNDTGKRATWLRRNSEKRSPFARNSSSPVSSPRYNGKRSYGKL